MIVKIIKSAEEARQLRDLVYTEDTALDTEAVGFDAKKSSPVNRGSLFLLSLSNRRGTWVVPFQFVKYLKFWLYSNYPPKYLANWKFDAHILANHGFKLKGVKFDVILADWLKDENKSHDLKTLGREVNLEMKSYKDLFKRDLSIEWEENRERVASYSALDAFATFKVKEKIEKELTNAEKDLLRFYLLPFGTILWRMERKGISVDQEYLDKQSKEAEERISEIEKLVNKEAKRPVNLRSTKDLRHLIYKVLRLPIKKTTKSLYCSECGKLVTKVVNYKCREHGSSALRQVPSTDAEVLNSFKSHYLVKKILKWRELEKLNSTYLRGLQKHLNNGKVHTVFSQIGTVTGRLSSSFPNLQNIPRVEDDIFKIRKAFRAERGKVFIIADYNQIELRVIAHFSRDPSMIAAFENDQDIHSAVAKKIFNLNCSVDKVKEKFPVERKIAKGVNFGILYGESERGLARRLNIKNERAKVFIDNFFSEYRGIKHWVEAVKSYCKKNGYVKTLLGRKRRLPEIEADDYIIRSSAERQAINAPIQGSAADIIMSAMLKLGNDDYLKSLECDMLLQVHDELIFECPEENAEKAASRIKEIMESPLICDLRVPLRIDYRVSKNWAE